VTETDPGYGPPPGNPTGPARGGGVPFDVYTRSWMKGLDVDTNDPAFRRPIDATDANTAARAKLVYRDVPIVAIQNTWSIEQIRAALYAHMTGTFYASGMLCDSMLGDDRITATLNSRAAGWLGREVRFKPADDSSAARECLDAWEAWWPRLSGDSAIRELADYSTMMGFGHGQLVWDTEQPGLDFAPSIRPWHPIFTFYDWTLRTFMAIGQDGVIPIVPGNGKWLEIAPFGSYRGWIRGAIRPCAEPWTLRHYGFRDMARFGEVHGNPTRIGYVPMVGDPVERSAFEAALVGLGADAAMMIPRGVDLNDGLGYDYKLVEATSKAWEVHPAQIDRCDMAIVLALLMVNLTTQVEGGSYGAAKAQMDVRSEGSQLDNQTWKRTVRSQLARPFAYLNFGDANLAPWTWWDVKGKAEYADNARQFQAVGTAIEALTRGGVSFTDAEKARRWIGETFGLTDFPAFDFAKHVSAPVPAPEEKTDPPKLEITPTDMATVVTVDEARANAGLGPASADGALTIAEYKAKFASTIAEAAAAEAGQTAPVDANAPPPAAFGGDGSDGEEDDDDDG
jgi:hypothetical protein